MADVCLTLYPIELGGFEMAWEQTMEEMVTEEGKEGKVHVAGWKEGRQTKKEAKSTDTSYHSKSRIMAVDISV